MNEAEARAEHSRSVVLLGFGVRSNYSATFSIDSFRIRIPATKATVKNPGERNKIDLAPEIAKTPKKLKSVYLKNEL